MADDREARGPAPAGARRALYWLVTLATPVLALAACEGLARLALSSGAAPDPKLTLVDIPAFFEKTRIDGRPYYRIAHDEMYSRREVMFPAEKPAGSLRIFCLGGSASAGWPHPKAEIYSAYLEQALRRAYPDRPIQVINASTHAYAAYRVRLVFDQVIDLDPDLIVVYSGNNEFLERRTYLPPRERLEPLLERANGLASFRIARAWLGPRLFPENALSGAQRQHVAYDAWSKIAQVALDLRSDPVQFAEVKRHYRRSIEAMVERAGERGVPVVLVSVPVNLRDWHPNVSQNALAGAERERWQAAFDAGRAALLRAEPADAVRHFEAALALDPGHAESHFLLARALESTGAWDAALERFGRARDLDHNPFRALSDFNATLREVAARHAGAHLADAEAAFLRVSAPRAPGFDLLLDYVHPTRAGNLLVAEAVFDAITADRLLGAAPEGGFQASPSPRYDERADVGLQNTLLLLFAMMHQDGSLVARAHRYAEPGTNYLALAESVLAVFPEKLAFEREQLLGAPPDPERAARVAAAVDRFYDARFPLFREGAREAAGLAH